MVALHGTSIVRIPLTDATARAKLVNPSLCDEFKVFFG
jgi:6-phosphofructokinase 1